MRGVFVIFSALVLCLAAGCDSDSKIAKLQTDVERLTTELNSCRATNQELEISSQKIEEQKAEEQRIARNEEIYRKIRERAIIEKAEIEAATLEENSNQWAVEGRLVDWDDNPMAGIAVLALQIEPFIKGYEQFETVTKSDGTFRLSGLYILSQYAIQPWSDKWTCETEVRVDSVPPGETALLSSPLKIKKAYSKSGGSLVFDLDTGATRFEVSSDGVILDTKTGFKWIVLPKTAEEKSSKEKREWVSSCPLAGGGWRIPTIQEVKTLKDPGFGHDVDPVFPEYSLFMVSEGCFFHIRVEHCQEYTGGTPYSVVGIQSHP